MGIDPTQHALACAQTFTDHVNECEVCWEDGVCWCVDGRNLDTMLRHALMAVRGD